MSGYTKLFSDIIESSIWNEPPDTCKVWITLLALSDQDGYVRGSVGWLAGKARVSKEKCAAAIALFQRPDEESRTPDHEGRRIESLDDGWLILNYIVFRDRLSQNPVNVKTRERVKRHRERYKALRNASSVTTPDSASASVSVTSLGQDKRGMQGGGFPVDGWELSFVVNTASSPDVAVTKKMAEECFNCYASKEWHDKNGNPVGRTLNGLKSLLRQWKTREPSIGKSYREPTRNEPERRYTSL